MMDVGLGFGGSLMQYPVYFAHEDENLINILKEVVVNDAAGRPATAMTGG
jgi:hypothetical protein